MKQHVENTRRQLGELAVMAERTAEEERRILKRAESLLQDVEAEIESLRPTAFGSAADGDRYTHLVEERGRLHQVIAGARKVLELDA